MPTVVSNGVPIHYEVEGEGPPLTLHTGGGGDLDMWRLAGYTEGLTGNRLLLMDHRGRGKSGRPDDIAQHRIDHYVRDVLVVADDAGVERFAFFGYSAGAAVGYRLAAKHPARVVALIGLGAVGSPDEDDSESLDLAARLRREGSDSLVSGLRAQEPELPDWFADQMRSTDPEMFALTLEAWTAWGGPWAEFADIEVPTLLVVGQLEEGDGEAAGANATTAALEMRDGRAEVLPGVGHVMAFVHSELVLPPVRAFLDGSERPGPT
jgi:pimeloyl-ACP methyl ester carboxylesterase